MREISLMQNIFMGIIFFYEVNFPTFIDSGKLTFLKVVSRLQHCRWNALLSVDINTLPIYDNI